MKYPAEYTAKVRVNYYDTDRMGVVWHGNYLKYFEDAREEMLRVLGLPYGEIEKAGVMTPVVEASVKYMAPARYDEVLDVKVRIAEPPRARMVIDYEIVRPDGSLCATGQTTLAFVDCATHAPCRPPAAFRADRQPPA